MLCRAGVSVSRRPFLVPGRNSPPQFKPQHSRPVAQWEPTTFRSTRRSCARSTKFEISRSPKPPELARGSGHAPAPSPGPVRRSPPCGHHACDESGRHAVRMSHDDAL
jgi:hypothetical protein